MPPTANMQLIAQIKAFQAKGETRDAMMAALADAGWTEADISLAMFAINNQDNQPVNDTDQAAIITLSNTQADDTYEDLRDQTIVDGLAGTFGPGPGGAYYQSKFYDDIGVGYWSTHALDLGAALLAYWLHAPWIYVLVATAVSIHVAYSSYKVIWWRRHRKSLQMSSSSQNDA